MAYLLSQPPRDLSPPPRDLHWKLSSQAEGGPSQQWARQSGSAGPQRKLPSACSPPVPSARAFLDEDPSGSFSEDQLYAAYYADLGARADPHLDPQFRSLPASLPASPEKQHPERACRRNDVLDSAQRYGDDCTGRDDSAQRSYSTRSSTSRAVVTAARCDRAPCTPRSTPQHPHSAATPVHAVNTAMPGGSWTGDMLHDIGRCMASVCPQEVQLQKVQEQEVQEARPFEAGRAAHSASGEMVVGVTDNWDAKAARLAAARARAACVLQGN